MLKQAKTSKKLNIASLAESGGAVRPTTRTAHPLPSTLITIQQFCAAYAVGRTRAYELLNDGEIEAIKSGHRTLILMSSVEAWFRRQERFGAPR